MPIELFSIGGYEESGRNMSAINVDGEIYILDMGWDLGKYLLLPPSTELKQLSTAELIDIDVFPDDEILMKYRTNVKAIILSHAHLDHISAVPRMAPPYAKAPIIGTPFTIEVLKAMIKDQVGRIPNKLIPLNPGSKYELSKNVTLEFVYVTHSTLQCVIVALHTPYGIILYANDWKFDNYPVVGQKTDVKRLKQMGGQGVLGLISCCINVEKEQKTYSEIVVTDMLKDILFGVENSNNAIITTTFASKIDRIKTLVQFAERMGRKPVLMGSSMEKYMRAAEACKLVEVTSNAEVYARRSHVAKALREINRKREDYLLIVTGHQGEHGSVLDRISRRETPFTVQKNDQILFCSSVIPAPVNRANRAELENRLRRFKPRIFKDVHVSGHGSKEDHRDLMKMVKPQNFIPCHGTVGMLANSISLAYDFDMKLGKDAHILQNSNRLPLE
jgi:ribonuclease J